MSTLDAIREQLLPLAPVVVDIGDDSALHAGHAGARSGGGHYRLLIVSAAFAGRRTMERHRLVYDALASLMKRDIHALSISAFTPDEYHPSSLPQESQ